MSSVGLSGLSNISSDTLQNRYEKALKQINKLIQINRQLKQKAGQYEGQLAQVQEQTKALTQENLALDEENNILESKYMELNHHYEELQLYCKKLEQELEDNSHAAWKLDQQIKENEQKHHEEIEHELEKYNLLARESQYLQQGYQDTLSILQEREKEKLILQAEIEELRRVNSELTEANRSLNEMITEKHILQLQSQLNHANNNISSLIKQCNDLKGKQIDIQGFQQIQKVEKLINLSTSVSQFQGDAVKELILQYKKKIRELEAEKKATEHKYKALKNKLSKSPTKENYQKKIESLQRLTQKQQAEIAKLIQTYDSQLHYMLRENSKISKAYQSIKFSVTAKDRAINELKTTSQRINREYDELKRMSQLKLKENSMLKDQIQHTESVTYGQKAFFPEIPRQSGEGVKMKISQVQKGVGFQSPNLFDKQDPLINASFEANKDSQKHKIPPITMSYNNPSTDKGDFKFIQSVNIINGYNVSLSENPGKNTL